MIVMNSTFASSGMAAMRATASPTWSTSNTGSAVTRPSGCGMPAFILSVIGVSALPMSIWLQAMSCARPSSARLLVSPVIACFVAV